MQEALVERGISYVALGSGECDITEPESVLKALNAHRPDVVVNCAAWTGVDAAEDNKEAAFAVNCGGAGNVARACGETGATLVHVSTDYVFAGTGSGPYAEDAATAPVSVYGKSKLCGEEAVRAAHGSRSYVIRTAWLYSRHGGNFAKTMLRRALAGAAVRVVEDQFGQPTLAEDLARHIIDIVASSTPFGVYHGTNSGSASWYDFATALYEFAGADTSLVSPVASTEYPTKAVRPSNSVLGHDRTVTAGMSEMRPWRDAAEASAKGIIYVLSQETGT